MAIHYLEALIAPPATACESVGTEGWIEIERRMGVGLPDDYKEFINVYGSGQIASFICVFNPFSLNENINLSNQSIRQAAVLQSLKSVGEVLPYEPYPHPGGILPFGMTDNGDVLFWRTRGEPNQWPVLVNEARAPDWEIFNCSMSQFLAGVLSKEIICELFPKNFPSGALRFVPLASNLQ